ncbi:hypothetical protein [Belnapia sp. F-4-1]|uniref:hypothetical protein n=1 Tax=Belnapia sp. F-4-1 TaxID=1545443 RepID=UPI0005B8CE2A|nr:hypothetical protein [Belnapia sp. F-4-1]
MTRALLLPFRALRWTLYAALWAYGHILTMCLLLGVAWQAAAGSGDPIAGFFVGGLLLFLSNRLAWFLAGLLGPTRTWQVARLPEMEREAKPQRVTVAVAQPSKQTSPREDAMWDRLPPELIVLFG